MITPQKIQDLSEPIESIYTAIVNELMVNIGKHITSPTWTHTADWEIRKLSELGQLTKENAAIINKWIKQIPPAMRQTMTETRRIALDQLERQMEQAEKDGYVTPQLADSTEQVLREYSEQAMEKLNMVNTTMLQSTLAQYQKAVQLTADTIKRAEETNRILNEQTGAVVVGAETRTQAVRSAIKQIADEGLTGFYDKAGRSWTPEAYVNMVVRTTVHNTAVKSAEVRMKDYGTDVFQISSHAGARPLCYPYQGWFCSWSNQSGDIELGDGSYAHYRPINDTSYGQPAGIFGINCGHYPIPIIAGYTIPHGADNIQPKEENDKAYAESQEQRALERQIRAAKRVVEMGDTSDEAKQAVKDAQAKMRQFIAETGRTRRYDRESLYGSVKKVNSQLTSNAPTSAQYGDAINTISANYKQGAETMLANAPAYIQKAWTDNAANLHAPQFDLKNGAHFDPYDGKTHFASEAKAYEQSTYQEKYACFFHEFGHNIDYLLAKGTDYLSTTYKNGTFGETIYKECEKRIKEFWYAKKGFADDYDALKDAQNSTGGMGIGAYIRQALRHAMPSDEYRRERSTLVNAGNDDTVLRQYFKKYLANDKTIEKEVLGILHQRDVGNEFVKSVKSSYDMYERTDVSDMFNKYMLRYYKISYPFGIGHKNSYWGTKDDYTNLAIEAFAEMFSATTTNNKSLATIKTMFPESYKMFEEMLGGTP